MKNILFAFIFVSLFFSQLVFSKANFKLNLLTQNYGVIWGMTFISPNEILFTTKDGKFAILNIQTKIVTDVNSSLDVKVKGQGGLLDVKTSPNYKTDKLIYFTYSKKQNDYAVTTLGKARLKDKRLIEVENLLISKSKSSASVHFGSRITFDEKGHVFFTIGDRGVRPNAQDLTNHAGSVIRLNLDGSIPKDNPFINNPRILNEIYTYGHRNPQGIFYDKNTKRLFEIEHGPRGGDEINIIKKGLNYGWPVISYGKEYWSPASVGEGTHKEGMEQPIKVYIPSIAPSSIIVYSGKAFPLWKGNIFSGALILKHLNRIVLDKNLKVLKEERLLKKLNERIRNVIESEKGWLYISTDSGKIFEMRP